MVYYLFGISLWNMTDMFLENWISRHIDDDDWRNNKISATYATARYFAYDWLQIWNGHASSMVRC